MVRKFAYYPVAMDLLCRSDRAFWRLVYAGLYQYRRFHIEPEEHAVRVEKTEIEAPLAAAKNDKERRIVSDQATKPACSFSGFSVRTYKKSSP